MVWLVLTCLVHSTMLLAAMMPLLTPLARQFGLGNEGTSVFVAAFGLGNLIGPILAPLLFKRIKLSLVFLLTGFMTPLAVISIGVVRSVPVIGILALVAAAALAVACLRVIVNTILQRLTPDYKQGCVFGAEQALLGLGWIISLTVITSLMSTIAPGLDIRKLFLFLGGGGLLMMSACWAMSRREIQNACIAAKPLTG